jgi:hypothetical protein
MDVNWLQSTGCFVFVVDGMKALIEKSAMKSAMETVEIYLFTIQIVGEGQKGRTEGRFRLADQGIIHNQGPV